MTSSSYLRHNGAPVITLDIAERHLRALVFVDLELRVVDERDLIDGYCALLATYVVEICAD